MDWSGYIDIYCERLEPGFWAEPVNAITNAAFLIAALIVWPMVGGRGRLLAALVCAVGIASFLFHTFATQWGSAVDVGAIAVFTLTYLYFATRDLLRWPFPWAAPILFFPYIVVTTLAFNALPFFNVSNAYWGIALLIAIYGWLIRPQPAGRGLLIAAALLSVSITVRSLDMPFCDAFPLGTHFVWHILNGITLGWLVLVYDRHVRAA